MMFPVKILLLVTSATITSEAVCHSSIELADGPLNIARTMGESFVAIPCPFSGQYQVVWKINGLVYEMFGLPNLHGTQLVPISSGLLIPYITKEFEGKSVSFQCFYPKKNGLGFKASTIGTMTVMKQLTDTKHLLNDGTHVSFIREQDFSLDIDHQRLFFEPENKTFAWKIINMTMENEAICIDMYRVISQEGCIPIPDPNDDFCDTCERSAIDEWPSYFKENVTIGTDDLLDNGTPVQFNIVPDDDECSDVTLIEKFQLNKDVDTTELKTSTSGQMFIDRYISAHLVIPSEDDNSYDCYCPYYFEDECYDFKTQCGCIKRTAFHDSNSELRICRQNNVIMDSMQISNMTDKINSTKLHIYEGYSRCPRCASGTCPYRNYVKALVLSHVLPEQPEIIVFENHTTFCFESQKIEGILLDYYEVTIADITKEVLSSKNYESSQCVHTEKLDHFDICSPFTLSVRAVNIFGSNVNNENVESDEGSPLSDVCSCLHARVFIYLNVTPEVSSIRAEAVEYNDYLSDAQYEIRLSGFCQNETNFTACYNESKNFDKPHSVLFEHLECQQNYIVQVWWISNDNFTECYLNETITSPSCPENHLAIILISTAIAGCTVIIISIIVVIAVLCSMKKSHSNRATRQDESPGSSDTQYGSTGESVSSADGTSL